MAKKSKKEKEDNWWRKYTKGYLENAENSGKSKKSEKSKSKRKEASSEPSYFDPFEQMEMFSRQMDKMFGDMFKSSFGPGIPRVLKMREGKFRRPRANIQEKDDKIFVAVELPGMNKEDIKTKVEGRNLIIDAKKKSESRKEEEGFSEFRSGYSGYRHVIRLPSEVEKEKSKAKFENGILKVILQKKESDEGPSDIDVE